MDCQNVSPKKIYSTEFLLKYSKTYKHEPEILQKVFPIIATPTPKSNKKQHDPQSPVSPNPTLTSSSTPSSHSRTPHAVRPKTPHQPFDNSKARYIPKTPSTPNFLSLSSPSTPIYSQISTPNVANSSSPPVSPRNYKNPPLTPSSPTHFVPKDSASDPFTTPVKSPFGNKTQGNPKTPATSPTKNPTSPGKSPFRSPRPISPLDEQRLLQRQKQIDYGYRTVGYLRYRLLVAKDQRKPENPRTPKKNQACSKRSWDGQLKKWRRDLHLWDPDSLEAFRAVLETDLVLNITKSNPELAEIVQIVKEKIDNPQAFDKENLESSSEEEESKEPYPQPRVPTTDTKVKVARTLVF